MGLFTEFFKMLSSGETPDEKNKRIPEKLLMDEAKALGLTKEEIDECLSLFIVPLYTF